jgi:hypothetical protein
MRDGDRSTGKAESIRFAALSLLSHIWDRFTDTVESNDRIV